MTILIILERHMKVWRGASCWIFFHRIWVVILERLLAIISRSSSSEPNRQQSQPQASQKPVASRTDSSSRSVAKTLGPVQHKQFARAVEFEQTYTAHDYSHVLLQTSRFALCLTEEKIWRGVTRYLFDTDSNTSIWPHVTTDFLAGISCTMGPLLQELPADAQHIAQQRRTCLQWEVRWRQGFLMDFCDLHSKTSMTWVSILFFTIPCLRLNAATPEDTKSRQLTMERKTL